MRTNHVELFELREKLLAVELEADRARRLASRAGDPSLFEAHVAEFESHVAELMRQIDQLEAELSAEK